MKKFLALLLATLMIATLVACSGNKDDVTDSEELETVASGNNFVNNDIGTFTYDVGSDGHYEITGYTMTTATAHEITIPEKINDIDVTSIGAEAFKACTTITAVTIPNTVENIGDLAFYGCNSIKKITLPDSVITVGVGAFRECTALEEIVLSKSIVTLSKHAFFDCTALKTVNLPDSLEVIGEAAFWNCDALTSVTVPAKVKEIGDSAFYGCGALASISVPESVKTIGTAAFSELSADGVVISGKAGSYVDTYYAATYGINDKSYSHYEFKAVS